PRAASAPPARAARLRTLPVGPAAGEWPERRRAIADFLGLAPETGAPPADVDLAPLAGSYLSPRGREARLSIQDGVLVAERLLWLGHRLLPPAPLVCDAEAWPFPLTFE